MAQAGTSGGDRPGDGDMRRTDGSDPASGDRAVWIASAAILAVGLAAVGLVALQRGDVAASPGATPSVSRSSPPEGPWQRVDSLGTTRDDFGTVVLDDRIWVTGGMTGDRGDKLATTEIYDPSTDRWELGVPMPTGRSSLAAAQVGGSIYAIGGSTLDSPYLDIVEAYDPEAGTWTRLAPMTVPRYGHAAVALDELIYVIGGQTSNGPTAEVEIFDPATGSWTAGPPMATARGSMRAVVWDGKIWAGGGNTIDGPSDTWEVFDPSTGSWSAGPAMPAPMHNFGLAVYADELHAIYHEHHFVLGAGDDAWRTEDPPPISRHGLGMIQLGDVLYAIAGSTEDPLVDINTVQIWSGA